MAFGSRFSVSCCCGSGGGILTGCCSGTIPATINLTASDPNSGSGFTYYDSAALAYSPAGPSGDPGAIVAANYGGNAYPSVPGWWSPLIQPSLTPESAHCSSNPCIIGGYYYVLRCGNYAGLASLSFSLGIVQKCFTAGACSTSVAYHFDPSVWGWNLASAGNSCSPFLLSNGFHFQFGILRSTGVSLVAS